MNWTSATRGTDTSLGILTTLPASLSVSTSTGFFSFLWKGGLEKAQQSIDLSCRQKTFFFLKTVNRMLNLKICIFNEVISVKHIGEDKHHRIGREGVCESGRGVVDYVQGIE